jgi:hypothetical protein
MLIKHYNFDVSDITALTVVSNYVWIGFKKHGDYCQLYKVSAFYPYQIFYKIDVPVDKIIKIKTWTSPVLSDYVFVLVEDNDYICIRYNHYHPLTDIEYFDKPSGINEEFIDLAMDDENAYFLTSGIPTARPAKIFHYTITGNYIRTYELIESP